jgi:hypothetical protein
MFLEMLSSGIVPAALLVSVLILVLKIREMHHSYDDRVIKNMSKKIANELLNRKLVKEAEESEDSVRLSQR